MSEQETAFLGDGFEDIPNTHVDLQKMRRVSEMSDEQISRMIGQYNEYLMQPDIMPRAYENGERILAYAVFEKAYRGGYLMDIPNELGEELEV